MSSDLRMSNSIALKVRLVALATLVYLLVTQQVDCFSTPSVGRSVSSSGRDLGSQANSKSYKQDESSEYTNNYIMAIEDQSTQPAGLMVSTTDHNYAIQSPRLAELDWRGLTVNGAQVFILTMANRSLSANLFALAESERDFIAETRAKFTQNLAGLKFAYYTSGSTLALSAPSSAAPPVKYSEPGGYYPPVASYHNGPQTVASNAISQLNDVNYLASLQEARRRGFARTLPEPTADDVRFSLKEARDHSHLSHLNNFIEKRAHVNGDYHHHHHLSPSEHKFARARGFKQQVARHSSGSYRIVDERENNHHGPRAKLAPKFSKCSYQNLVNLNYYNLKQAAEKLNGTLAGDIYYFDFHCNILDVYSSSVSVRRQPDVSVLYRDHRYFSYSRSQLPLEINRFFLAGDQVIFVYNDGSLLLKQSWMLDPIELDLVLKARQELMNITGWQSKAADLLSKGVSGSTTTSPPTAQGQEETTTTTTERPDADTES